MVPYGYFIVLSTFPTTVTVITVALVTKETEKESDIGYLGKTVVKAIIWEATFWHSPVHKEYPDTICIVDMYMNLILFAQTELGNGVLRLRYHEKKTCKAK